MNASTSELHTFNVDRVGPPLTHPWSVAFLPNGEILVGERGGSLYRYSNAARRCVKGLPSVSAIGQGGLMDIEPHPDFSSNKLIFFSFTAGTAGRYHTAVARARLVDYQLENLRVIFSANTVSSSRLHFGSRISFMSDGTLLVTLGERGNRHAAQDATTHDGTVIRIDTDGVAPRDNPFIDNPQVLNEIYSLGHRNPQGLAIGADGIIYLHEHGPRGGDEINRVIAGKNYGWPRVTFGREYANNAPIGIGSAAPGYESPLLHWTPSIAPSGMMIYSGKRFPRWQNHLFVGALAGKHIARVELSGAQVVHQERLLSNQFGRIRDIKEDPNGDIWFITDQSQGALYKISP